MNSYTDVALSAAKEAAALLKKGFGTSFKIDCKEGRHNLVTEFDKKAEALIISHIQSHFPDHQFLGEEGGKKGNKHSEVIWIIDPLDGTVNFAHGIPFFSVSIAAIVNQTVVSGVVYNPLTDECFLAEKEQGAYLNGSRLRVSQTKELKDCFLASGFPYNVDENPLNCADTCAEISKMGIPIRLLGSAALDLAYTAAGKLDGFWEVSLCPWDFAAGLLLVEEAQGRVTTYLNHPLSLDKNQTLVATNGFIHEALRERVNPLYPS